MIEVFFLIGKGDVILWSDVGANAGSLPDSRARWEAIWSNRDQIEELAHSHPMGPLAFSHEDTTTMEALEAALGRPLRFSVVAPGGIIVRQNGVDEIVRLMPASADINEGRSACGTPQEEPWWAALLRRASGF